MTRNARRTRDPREIEAELDFTRTRMSDTLDRLESKMSPGALFENVWNYVRSKGDGQTSSNLKEIIARNPLPVTLVGLGLAWLMMSGRRGSVASNRTSQWQRDDSASMSEDLQAGVPSRTDQATHGDQLAGVDEASAKGDELGSTAYGGGRSDVVESDDEVAKGLDETSPTSKKTGVDVQESSSSTSGPRDSAAEGLGGASTNTEKRT